MSVSSPGENHLFSLIQLKDFQRLREGMMEAMGLEGFQNFVNTLPRAPVRAPDRKQFSLIGPSLLLKPP